MMPIKLSIVIPTFNRANLIGGTVNFIENEIAWLPEGMRGLVEFLVVDNASTDDTNAILSSGNWTYAKMVRCPEHLNIAGSIARAVTLTQGDFVWVFGDDDLIPPGFLRHVCEKIEVVKGGVVMLYFNRLIVDWHLKKIIGVAHRKWEAIDFEIKMGAFIEKYSHWPGFVTSMIFRRSAYDAGSEADSIRYDGWVFLARIYLGGANGDVVVGNFPSLAQRLGIHSWKASWPEYWLVNMPRMLHFMDLRGVSRNALEVWRRNEVSPFRVLIDSVVAKAFGVNVRSPFWREAISYQVGANRVILVLVWLFVPCLAAKMLYLLQPKYRK